jgi:hypothetical protein
VSADWQTFLEWLQRHGMKDQDEAWRMYSSMTPEKPLHRNAVKLIDVGAGVLPGPMRVSVAAGVALLMREYEWSPRSYQLCQELGTRIRDVANELDTKRPHCIASALVCDWDGQEKLENWRAELIAIGVMLMSGPAREMMQPLGSLCNRAFAQLSAFLRNLVRKSDERDKPYMRGARVAYMDALTRYSDAARRLERELGQVVFLSEPLPLGTEGLPP